MTESPTRAERVGPLDLLAFACEIGMLVLLAVAGWALGGATVTRVLLAVALPLVAMGIWGVWMAPRSARRLRNPARLGAQSVLFATTGVLVALAGRPLWGMGFAVVAIAAFAARREDAAR